MARYKYIRCSICRSFFPVPKSNPKEDKCFSCRPKIKTKPKANYLDRVRMNHPDFVDPCGYPDCESYGWICRWTSISASMEQIYCCTECQLRHRGNNYNVVSRGSSHKDKPRPDGLPCHKKGLTKECLVACADYLECLGKAAIDGDWPDCTGFKEPESTTTIGK